MLRFVVTLLICILFVFPASAGPYTAEAGKKWVQVESQPDLATTKARAQVFASHFEHTEAFFTTSGWYAIVIGAVDSQRADKTIAALRASGSVPSDTFATDGDTYLTEVWPQSTEAGGNSLAAAVAREQSWNLDTRIGVQNALMWAGEYKGRLDGDFGRQTRNAIKSFQADRSYPETGYLTPDEIGRLETERLAAIDRTGFKIVTDRELGMRIGMATKLFRRVKALSDAIEFGANVGGSHATLFLLSTFGGTNELRGYYATLLGSKAATDSGYHVLRDQWFAFSDASGGLATYGYAKTGDGTVKGFVMFWPEAETDTYGPLSTAMFNSLESIPGVAFEGGSSAQSTPSAQYDASSGEAAGNGATSLAPTAPSNSPKLVSTGSGFYVDRSGAILTNNHVIDGCSTVTLGDGTPAMPVAEDKKADLALLRSTSGVAPDSTAEFAPRPARLNSDITVVGFPLYGLLGGINVTRGVVSSLSGLGGDSVRIQISAEVQPGNSGGPAIDRTGAVIGVVESKLNAVEVAKLSGDIPQNINFAIRGEIAKIFLTTHGVDFAIQQSPGVQSPSAIAERAQKYTVVLGCWK